MTAWDVAFWRLRPSVSYSLKLSRQGRRVPFNGGFVEGMTQERKPGTQRAQRRRAEFRGVKQQLAGVSAVCLANS